MDGLLNFDQFAKNDHGSNEARMGPSRSLAKAAEALQKEELALQKLRKQFIDAKGNEAKREKLKKQLIDQNKKVKSAESEFNRALGSEEEEFMELEGHHKDKKNKNEAKGLGGDFQLIDAIKDLRDNVDSVLSDIEVALDEADIKKSVFNKAAAKIESGLSDLNVMARKI